ncbi:MAG: hypothetical protein M3463_08650 [Verrucomicrobiota bacterium]|nr:hypothetical protein [Verrucomicrobiota bacterium]
MFDDIKAVKDAVAQHAHDFAEWRFPRGKRIGSRWHIGDLSGEPGRSLTVDLDGEFAGNFHDWETGERGDCIELTMRVLGLEFGGALRVLRERYGFPAPLILPAGKAALQTFKTQPQIAASKRPDLQSLNLERGCREDFLRLSSGRRLAFPGLVLASEGERGLLWFYDSCEGRAWLITDRAGRNAQARRLDGKPWSWNGAKAWTIAGSCASWPIGLPESEPFPAISMHEGGPDLLAGFHYMLPSGTEDLVAPVCMTGASVSIPAECLSAFAGKRVRIFVHDDEEGREAGHRWRNQLHGIALHVDGFRFEGFTRTDGTPVKDLCDFASSDPGSWEAHTDPLKSCMAFAVEGRAL